MPTQTERHVDAVLAVLDYLRNKGVIPIGTDVSPEFMAWVSDEIEMPVSETTFHRLQRRGLARLKKSEKARLAFEAWQSRHQS